ncbi:MAG: DciA family protein [Pseudomonadota bacterium]
MTQATLKRRAARARPLAALLPDVTRSAFQKFGFPAAALLTEWEAIVGVELARFTSPERVKWPKLNEDDLLEEEGAYGRRRGYAGRQNHRSGTLVLRVDGPLALELQHRSDQILGRINQYFGYRAIGDLRVLQAPLSAAHAFKANPSRSVRPPAPGRASGIAQRDLAHVSDDRLRTALASLARRIDGS